MKFNTPNETIFSIDLKKLESNFNYLKNTLLPETKIIAVIKAFAYGHGDVKIAKRLEKLGVYAFWVTDFEEGIILRKAGLKSKIIVANPGIKSYEKIITYKLDVVVYSHRLLDLYSKNNYPINIHLKFNTGMNRYGFENYNLKKLIQQILNNPHINLLSICSHLASAEKPTKDKFTLTQIKRFESLSAEFEKILKKPILKHILNSYGVINYNKYQMDAVRLGIGLYGGIKNNYLTSISKLESVVTQSRVINKGETVGYGCSFIARKKMKISIVPVGYADGLNRKLSNGVGKVIINGLTCPIVGKISMGTFVVDTTNKSVKEGDIVEIFGENLCVSNIAKSINTIPYEIYATLNRRLKRIYLN